MDLYSVCKKMSGDNYISEEGLLVSYPNPRAEGEDRDIMFRLVIPESLQIKFRHHHHTSLEKDHQGVGGYYKRTRRHCH